MANNKDFKVKNGLDVGSTVTLNAYGAGTNTGLPTQALNVDENGNVIEADAGVLPFVVHNNTGATLVKGTVVYVSGLNGNTPEVSLARANSSSTMPAYGLVEEDILNTADGTVVTFGSLRGLDVSEFGETGITFSLGDTVYVSSSEAGKLTNVAPTGEANLIQNIGKIERASPTTNMTIKVGGAGRTNATPNLNDGNFFLGNGSNQAVPADFAEQVDDRVNTLVTDGTGITTSYDDVANTLTFNHSNSVTSGTVSEGGVARQLGYGDAFNIPSVTYDSEGHITATTTTQITLPASDNTDTTYTAGDGLTLTGTDFDVDLTDTVTFTSTNTASKAVVRDASGNFAAGTITADLTGDVTGTVSSLSNHDTDDLSEGVTNQYYTDARADARVNLQTGTNLDLSSKNTDDLSQGSTNLYYNNSLVDAHLNQANPTDGYVLSWTSGDYAWVAGGGSTQTEEHPTVTNGSATVTLANARTLNEIEVYLNGVKLRGGTTLGGTTEWTVSGTTLTFNQNLSTGDEVTVVSLVTATAALAEEFPTVTAGSADVTMSQAFTLSQIDVYLNGVRLKATDEYTVSGSTLTLGENLVSGDIVAVVPRIEATDATLASLSDTNVTGVADGELLKYDNSTSKYVPTAMVETSAGNVGIGTASPNFLLDVEGASNSTYLRVGGDDTNNDRGLRFTSSASASFNGAVHTINAPSSQGEIAFATGSTEALRIDGSGNVGIGTSNPTFDLEVDGGSLGTTSGDEVEAFRLKTTTGTNVDTLNFKKIREANGSDWTTAGWRIQQKIDNIDMAYLQLNGDGNIYGLSLGTANAERMRIDSAGNVGIGTTSPSSKLHVADSIRVARSSFAPAIYFENSSYTGGDASIRMFDSGHMLFSTDNTEQMRITDDGEVRIAGTTDRGSYNLQVNGTGVWGQGSYVTGSDERMKEEITDLNGGLEVVNQLRPVTYRYREEFSKDRNIQAGFIAQEVKQALSGKNYAEGTVPEMAEYLSVAYQNLIPVLTAAIQEQQTQIEAQQATIEALEARLTALEGA